MSFSETTSAEWQIPSTGRPFIITPAVRKNQTYHANSVIKSRSGQPTRLPESGWGTVNQPGLETHLPLPRGKTRGSPFPTTSPNKGRWRKHRLEGSALEEVGVPGSVAVGRHEGFADGPIECLVIRLIVNEAGGEHNLSVLRQIRWPVLIPIHIFAIENG